MAVTTAIALILQGKHKSNDGYDVEAIIQESEKYAFECMDKDDPDYARVNTMLMFLRALFLWEVGDQVICRSCNCKRVKVRNVQNVFKCM